MERFYHIVVADILGFKRALHDFCDYSIQLEENGDIADGPSIPLELVTIISQQVSS
jgi:hypothetical protein